MTSIKCPQCGFVTLRTNTKCKRCGAGLNAAAAPREVNGSGRAKILLICAAAAGAVLVIAALGWAILAKLATFGEPDSSPVTLAALLNAEGRLKSPANVRILSELHDQFTKSDFDQKRFLQNYPEVSVLEQLGLVSVENFKVIKADKFCYRYDFDYSRENPSFSPLMGEDRYNERHPRLVNPNGPYEECTDLWDYSVNVRLVDPDTIDQAHLRASLQYSNTSISPPIEPWSIHDQYVFRSPTNNG